MTDLSPWSDLIAMTVAYATVAHAGQTDKAGVEYIHHPIRVAKAVMDDPTPLAGEEIAYGVCAALLHDTVEDTLITLEDLEADWPVDVVDAVDLLTFRLHDPHQTRDAYCRAIRRNRIAWRVKVADVKHNSDPKRLAKLPSEEGVRLADKYTKTLVTLGPEPEIP